MPDYQQSKIYKIINHELKGLVYYGSTTTTLKQRLSCHKTLNCSSKALFSVGTPEIILLEYYPCETKAELLKRERVWIEGNECVNHYIPGRTDKEYYQDNKDKLKDQNKKWKSENKEKEMNTRKIWDEKNKEKRLIYKREWARNKSKKHQEFISSNQPVADAADGHQN